MKSSKNLLPIVEANISKALIEQLEAWADWIIKQNEYDPQISGETALKTLAKSHGIRKTVAYMRSIHNKQKDGGNTDGGSNKQRQGRRGYSNAPRTGR